MNPSTSMPSKHGMVLQLADGTIQACNLEAQAILGQTLEQIQSHPSLLAWGNAIHLDGSPYSEGSDPITQTLQTGQPCSEAIAGFSLPTGKRLWLSISTQPLFTSATNPYGVVIGLAEVSPNQTELLSLNPQQEHASASWMTQSVQEIEERWQLALEIAHMFTFEWDPQSDQVRRSPHCASILGFSQEEAEHDTGKTFFQRVHPDDRERFVTIVHSLTPENHIYQTLYRMIRSDGTVVSLKESGRAFFNPEGQLIRLSGITADVTELQQSRALLQRQLAEIEAIYQSAPIGLNVLDTDLRFVRINQQLAEINGFSVEDHIGRTVRELLPELADAAETVLRPILETGQPLLNVEIRGETPAQPGVPRIWLEHFLPLKDGDRVMGISTVCEEITERKQIEAALRESEERFRQMAETISDIFWLIDIQQKQVLYISPAFEQIWGCSRDPFYQRFDLQWSYVYPVDRQRVISTLEQASETQGFEIEYRILRSDGVIRWLRDRGFLVPNEQGQIERLVRVTQDITRQKQWEQEREALLIRERSSREEAEQANRIKDEFLAMLSHELRTPLNPILGWAKLLQNTQLSQEKFQQGLEAIERNARQQVQLIDDLLDISRIIRGKLSLNFAPLPLSVPITAALETVHLAVEAKAIQLEVQLGEEVLRVMGDSNRLQQVCWNLFSNAIKFTPPGGQVRVQLTQEQHQAKIQVSDTGRGINPEFLPHIFELFRQQDSSTTRQFGGLGLGLAIARQVIEAHGGTLTATSAGEGKGADFTVWLPLIQPTPTIQPPVVSQPRFNLEYLSVLVVDDEPDSLELLTILLEQEGAKVTQASSARAALQALTQSCFHLLISDICMPDMDGYDLLRQIRSLLPQPNQSLPAIALTAYASQLDQEQAFAAGFQGHFAKPIEPDQFLAMVAQFTHTANPRKTWQAQS